MAVKLSSSVGEIAPPEESLTEVNKRVLTSSPEENISTEGCSGGENTTKLGQTRAACTANGEKRRGYSSEKLR